LPKSAPITGGALSCSRPRPSAAGARCLCSPGRRAEARMTVGWQPVPRGKIGSADHLDLRCSGPWPGRIL